MPLAGAKSTSCLLVRHEYYSRISVFLIACGHVKAVRSACAWLMNVCSRPIRTVPPSQIMMSRSSRHQRAFVSCSCDLCAGMRRSGFVAECRNSTVLSSPCGMRMKAEQMDATEDRSSKTYFALNEYFSESADRTRERMQPKLPSRFSKPRIHGALLTVNAN